MDRFQPKADDLFEKSSMTFGEHLDELRRCLFKALVWLGIGLAIGLIFANRIVRGVQEPLEQAMRQFYADKTLTELGYDLESEEAKVPRQLLIDQGLSLETAYVSLSETLETLGLSQFLPVAEAAPAEAAAAPAATGLSGNATSETVSEETPPQPAVDNSSSDTETQISAQQRLSLTDLVALQIFRPVPSKLSNLKMEEPFMVWMKAGLVAGAVIASPMIFYHLWSFVAAGLYPHERKYVYMYLPFSVALFLGGVILAFYGVLALVLHFFLTFNSYLNVDPVPRLSDYISFVLLLPLGFGIAFQLPMVMLVLERIGMFQTADYISSWRIAVLVIAVVSMVLTPSDVYSMLAMAVPLTGLYFLGIAMCKYMPRGPGLSSGDAGH